MNSELDGLISRIFAVSFVEIVPYYVRKALFGIVLNRGCWQNYFFISQPMFSSKQIDIGTYEVASAIGNFSILNISHIIFHVINVQDGILAKSSLSNMNMRD